ncbi:MAG: hypothetical protein KDI98_04055 [Hyphomicrobiaceae bacterium]|nr:hypothetical protein [Hyphomicrobiaceae bacterium]
MSRIPFVTGIMALLTLAGAAFADGSSVVEARWPRGVEAIITSVTAARLHSELQDRIAVNTSRRRGDRLAVRAGTDATLVTGSIPPRQ